MGSTSKFIVRRDIYGTKNDKLQRRSMSERVSLSHIVPLLLILRNNKAALF